MSLEIILWLVAFVVVVEFIYAIFLLGEPSEGWFENKLKAFFAGGFVIFIHYVIAQSYAFVKDSETLDYSVFLWEAGIIASILLFFWLNKKFGAWLLKNATD